MQQTTKRPATVRELGDMAEKMNVTAVQLMEMLSPWPMPPAGYVVDPSSDTRWLGPETFHRKWIITPVWNANTDTHSFDVWLAEHYAPTYANLTPDEAVQLAADLAAAQAARASA